MTKCLYLFLALSVLSVVLGSVIVLVLIKAVIVPSFKEGRIVHTRCHVLKISVCTHCTDTNFINHLTTDKLILNNVPIKSSEYRQYHSKDNLKKKKENDILKATIVGNIDISSDNLWKTSTCVLVSIANLFVYSNIVWKGLFKPHDKQENASLMSRLCTGPTHDYTFT